MKKLLLHTCCAPCMSSVYEKLSDSYDITLFFSNPNIHPIAEYSRRLEELKSFTETKGVKLEIGEYNTKEWFHQTREYRFYGEKSKRCWSCYFIRLEDTFKRAMELKMDMVSTVLSISPHKNADVINKIGLYLSEEYNIDFLVADFKKQDGFKRSLELSRKYNFYRQNYCGCIYSKNERERDSQWYQKLVDERSTIKSDELISLKGII